VAVPVILARNTGRQRPSLAKTTPMFSRIRPRHRLRCAGTEGWGESDVEEIVGGLERLYSDSGFAQRIGANGAGMADGTEPHLAHQRAR